MRYGSSGLAGLACLAALVAAACGADSGTAGGPVLLAAGFVPSPVGELEWADRVGRRLVVGDGESGGGLLVDLELSADDWREGAEGSWYVPRLPLDPATLVEVTVAGQTLQRSSRPGREGPERAGVYATTRQRLTILRDGAPDEARLRFEVERGGSTGERPEDARSRVLVGGFAGDGIPVLPGQIEIVTADLPPGSTLRFAAAASFVGPPDEPLTFRVLLDGAPLTEVALRAAEGAVWHSAALPPEGRDGAELLFEVEGPAALAAFVAPVVAPTASGGAPGDARPDIVIFLADTFRADNLDGEGGTPTPNLDAFAARSLRFENARSPANWTLPSHASLFTGLYPYQHGAVSQEQGLPDEAVTLAEHLSARGYRTGAITERGFVSARYGLDQGWEWWDEERALSSGEPQPDLARLRERVARFLDGDDGRPQLLFVHTYRVHTPYHVCGETLDELDRELADDELYDAVDEAMRASGWRGEAFVLTPEAAEHAPRLESLYRASARDLDRGFGALLEDLAERGIDEHAFVIFTSDHGEAFGEHARVGHAGPPHDEVIRIPLLIAGPGIAARSTPVGASLVDLPRTIAAMAGLEPEPAWLGGSLLSLDRDRPVVAQWGVSECGWVSVVEGPRKVMLRVGTKWPEDEPVGLAEAYDLGRDATEQDNLAEAADWPPVAAERLAGPVEALGNPRFGPHAVRMTEEDRKELEELGYTDE